MGTDALDFGGRSVVVVGGSTGIGNGIARAFAAAGADVTATGTRADAQAYASEVDSDFTGLTYRSLDVAAPGAIESFAQGWSSLDTLVLCQGAVIYKKGEFAIEGWDHVMQVNLRSLIRCATAFKPALAAAQGSLIIVSSISGFRANIGTPAYAASKAGAISLTQTLGAAWARDGIRVNSIAPGFVATRLTRVTTDRADRREAALARIPIGRLGTPEDMAGAALFLASPLASYVCGQTIVVDGGLLLN